MWRLESVILCAHSSTGAGRLTGNTPRGGEDGMCPLIGTIGEAYPNLIALLPYHQSTPTGR